MCRLAWLPEPRKVPEKVLVELFTYLEDQQGGSGNGFGGFINGGVVIEKGMKLTVEEIVKEIRSKEWDNGILFHTRMASKGSAIDKNCHPFNYNDVIVCHNGTLYNASNYTVQMLMDGIFSKEMKGGCKDSPDGKHLPKKKTGRFNAEFECAFCDKDLIDITDSEIITYLVSKYGVDILKTLMDGTYGGHVILIMDKDGVSAYTSGAFEVLEIKKGVFIYASDFPSAKTSRAKYPHLIDMMVKAEKSELLYEPTFESGKLFRLEPAITSLEELVSEVIKEPSTSTVWYANDWHDSRCGAYRTGRTSVTGSENVYDSYRQTTPPKPEKREIDLSPELFASLIVGNTILVEELEEIMKKEA